MVTCLKNKGLKGLQMSKIAVTRGYNDVIEEPKYSEFVKYTEKLNKTYKQMTDNELTRHIENW